MDSILEEKFNRVYKEYSNLLFSVIYPYLHNAEESKDVLQDVFVTYLKKKPNLEGDNLKYWLIRVAINQAKNYLKNFNRNCLEIIDEVKEESKDNNDEIIDIVYKLEDKYKSVIILYYYEDFKIEEIATSLKISISNVKQRLSRAREKLKIMIEGD